MVRFKNRNYIFKTIQQYKRSLAGIFIAECRYRCYLLKRIKTRSRIAFGKKNAFSYQAFGFDKKELKRANGMLKNYYFIKPIFPLIDKGYSKQNCLDLLNFAGIKIPVVYSYGFHNNNCFRTGCVQGGVGYWQKMKLDFPDKFDDMALMEHELTN